MDHTGDIRRRVRAAGWEVCVVVNDARVVLGLLRPEPVDADPQMTAEQVMESGPSTIRPHLLLDEVAQDMRKHGVESVLVTTSDGRLVGLLSRQEAERRLEEPR
jgi:CBS domain-containing protein